MSNVHYRRDCPCLAPTILELSFQFARCLYCNCMTILTLAKAPGTCGRGMAFKHYVTERSRSQVSRHTAKRLRAKTVQRL